MISEPNAYSGSLKRIQPSVPRQSGEVKISKLGMLQPTPSFHSALLPERQPEVRVRALDVQPVDRQCVEPIAVHGGSDRAPRASARPDPRDPGSRR